MLAGLTARRAFQGSYSDAHCHIEPLLFIAHRRTTGAGHGFVCRVLDDSYRLGQR